MSATAASAQSSSTILQAMVTHNLRQARGHESYFDTPRGIASDEMGAKRGRLIRMSGLWVVRTLPLRGRRVQQTRAVISNCRSPEQRVPMTPSPQPGETPHDPSSTLNSPLESSCPFPPSSPRQRFTPGFHREGNNHQADDKGDGGERYRLAQSSHARN